MVTRNTVDDGLSWQVQQIGRHFGMRMNQVRLDLSGAGRTHVYYRREKNDVIISSRLRETMSPDELEFVLASALTKLIRDAGSGDTAIDSTLMRSILPTRLAKIRDASRAETV